MALFVSGDLFFSLPSILPALRGKVPGWKEAKVGGPGVAVVGPPRRTTEGDSRFRAAVHLVSGLRGQDAVLAVENDVLLLGFVDVRPVDLLRDALELLLGYGITAVGEALWEELGGLSQPQEGLGPWGPPCAPSSGHLPEAGSQAEGPQSVTLGVGGQGPST